MTSNSAAMARPAIEGRGARLAHVSARRGLAAIALIVAAALTIPTVASGATPPPPPATASTGPVAPVATKAPATGVLAASQANAFAAISQAVQDRRRAQHQRALQADRADRTKQRRKQAVAADRDRRQRIAARVARAKTWATPTLSGRVTTSFGASGAQWSSGEHTGADFDGNRGDIVRAVHTGTVIFAGSDGRYGNHVKIRHRNGDQTWYAHLSRITVNAGQRVSTRDVIGRVGDTGNAFGPHLHFEVHPGGSARAIDPVPYLRAIGLSI